MPTTITQKSLSMDVPAKRWSSLSILNFAAENYSTLQLTSADGLTRYLEAQYTLEEPDITIDTIELIVVLQTAKTLLNAAITPWYIDESSSLPMHACIIPPVPFCNLSGAHDYTSSLGATDTPTYATFTALSIPINAYKKLLATGECLNIVIRRRDGTNWTANDQIYVRLKGGWKGGH